MYITFGLGAPSIYVEYHKRSAVALVTSLKDPSDCHRSVTINLLTHQISQVRISTTVLSTRDGPSLPLKRQLNLHTQARQLAYIRTSNLVQLVLKGNCVILVNFKLISEVASACNTPPPPQQWPRTLINCKIKPLMSLRINGIQNLTSANEGYITLGNSLKTSTPEFSKSTL